MNWQIAAGLKGKESWKAQTFFLPAVSGPAKSGTRRVQDWFNKDLVI